MISHKTKRGTAIRSTIGMKSPKTIQRWILTADRHRLCLFEQIKDELGKSLVKRSEFLNPEGRSKGEAFASDRPGRSFDSRDQTHHGQTGGSRHSYGNSGDPKDHAVKILVDRAIEFVEKSNLNHPQTHLSLFAEPRLMGVLKPVLLKLVPQCRLIFIEKDFAWVPEREARERINSVLEEEE